MRGLAEVLALLAAGTALALALVRIVHLLHMLQLEEYDTRRFVHWVVLHSDQLAANPMLDLLGLLGIVVLFLPLQLVSSEGVIVSSLSIVVGLTGLLWERRLGARSPVKKALVIRGKLGPEHEVLVVELAENEKGGFKHLLRLVPCSISIVTSVGLQHLEEFGSEAAIQRAMQGFVRMPGSGSTVVLNGDDPVLAEIGSLQEKKILRASAGGLLLSDLHAENIVMSADGLSFDVVMNQGQRIACRTNLLDRHNVENILLAVAVARELGLSWSSIQDGVATLQAPPHRLQMMTGAGVRIIDDAYNSNPAGFAMAME